MLSEYVLSLHIILQITIYKTTRRKPWSHDFIRSNILSLQKSLKKYLEDT